MTEVTVDYDSIARGANPDIGAFEYIDPDEVVRPLVISTESVTAYSHSAVVGGNITDDGGGTITSRGVCWSRINPPTIADNTTISGTGVGTFTTTLTGLEDNVTYYVAAYAFNEAGLRYGNTVEFTTLPDTEIKYVFQGGKIVFRDDKPLVSSATNPPPPINTDTLVTSINVAGAADQQRAQSTAAFAYSLPDPFGTLSLGNYKYSVYCNYTGGEATIAGNTAVFDRTSTSNYRRAVPVTFSEAGTIQSLSINHIGDGAGTGDILMGVYSDNSGPSALLGITATTEVNATAGWQTIDLIAPVAVSSGQKVWLAWVLETQVGLMYANNAIGGATTITGNNGTLQMFADVEPDNATDTSIVWSVFAGTGSALISSSGILTAVNDGTVTVRATALDGSGIYGEKVITLSNQEDSPAPILVSSITVTGTGGATTISVNDGTLQMLASVLPVNATIQTITWSRINGSGDASISSSGLLTALADGTVTVRATATDGSAVYGEQVITLSNQADPPDDPILVTSITVAGAGGATTITVNDGTLQMYATVLPADATDNRVTWSRTNGSGTASISGTGLLTALTDGTVTVRATALDGSGVYGTRVITMSNQSDVTTQIIIDHTSVALYDDIPAEYITLIKQMRGAIPGLSHASGYLKGLTMLQTLNANYKARVQYTGVAPYANDNTALRFGKNVWDYEFEGTPTPYWTAGYDVEEWCTDVLTYDPIANTKAGITYTLNGGWDLDAMGFGWCWDTEIDINDYITATQEYVDYCLAQKNGTKIFFTTGNVAPSDGSGYRATTGTSGEYAQSVKYETIRSYVEADADLILFDYADILCWDDNGTQHTVVWNGHTYPSITQANGAAETDADYYAHISTGGCLRLGKALWVIMARIAGWDGN